VFTPDIQERRLELETVNGLEPIKRESSRELSLPARGWSGPLQGLEGAIIRIRALGLERPAAARLPTPESDDASSEYETYERNAPF
jgi:hypothetical protein